MFRLTNYRRAKSFVKISIVCLLILFALNYLRPELEKRQTVGNKRSTKCVTRDFQVIEKDLAFAYSAYIDDRPARDSVSVGLPVVRIFVYFDRKIDAKARWQCRLSYEDSSTVVVTNVSAITDLDEFDSRRRFMPAMVLCVLPERGNLKLHGVSLVSKSTQNINNYICVVDLRARRDQFSNVASSLASKLSRGKFSDFTICVRVIHNDYYKAVDIVNFIEVNRLLGVDKFVFYADTGTVNFSSILCLEYYSRLGIVEVYPFTPPVPDPDGLLCHGQVITLNECPYRVMYRTKFVINIDLDEFIVPTSVSSLTRMFSDFQGKKPDAERIASYSFRNQFFPHQLDDDPRFFNDTTVGRNSIKTLLKTMKEDYIYPHNTRSKVIGRPERILIWHTHLVLQHNLIDQQDSTSFVESSDALLYHYREWSAGNNKLTRERRMHEYATQLTESIPLHLRSCLSLN